jgi:hypothetical protein
MSLDVRVSKHQRRVPERSEHAKYLVEVIPMPGGSDRHYAFPNGWEVSVIDYGYGSKAGLKEMMVWRGSKEKIIGWLSDEQVEENLSRVQKLGGNVKLEGE